MGKSFKGLTVAGVAMIFLISFLFSTALASPVTTLNQIVMPSNTTLTIKQAEKEYLKIQEQDKAELKTFLANPTSYSIVSTSDPRTALDIRNNKEGVGKRLAGSVLIPLQGNTGTGMGVTYKRVYKIYVVVK
jgi:hypothetical protein